MARICIIGGSGFVGQALARRLAQDQHQITVLTRAPYHKRALRVLPGLQLRHANVHNEAELAAHTVGTEVLINLVGILNESRKPTEKFRRVHVELAQRCARVCRDNQIGRLLQMSALGASTDAPSEYLRSKAEGEQTILDIRNIVPVTYFRPSVIFGPGDHFFHRFAQLVRLAPGFLPLACPGSRLAPVYVGDVAERMAAAIDDPDTYRRSLELCGPEQYTLAELVALTADMCGVAVRVVPLSPRLSRLQARLLSLVPGKLFTIDNYRSLQVDNVCTTEAGCCPTPIEPVMRPVLAA